jgi:1-acyl-sn-glycerol-3-phosphate acyltransferase
LGTAAPILPNWALAKGAQFRYFSACLSVSRNSNVEHRLLPRVAQAANRLFCRTYHNVQTRHPQQLPREGAAILVCNHISGLDPMLIQSACSRLIIWMMAREYYEVPSLTWLYKLVEAIPVERSGRDLAATRAALRALNEGRVVGIFPEGKIETDQNLLPFQTGVALMAIKTKVPVYPAYLDGTQRGREMVDAVAHPNRAAINFGPPVEFPRNSTSKEALEHATLRIKEAVWKLRPDVIGNGRANFSEVLSHSRPIPIPVSLQEN